MGLSDFSIMHRQRPWWPWWLNTNINRALATFPICIGRALKHHEKFATNKSRVQKRPLRESGRGRFSWEVLHAVLSTFAMAGTWNSLIPAFLLK